MSFFIFFILFSQASDKLRRKNIGLLILCKWGLFVRSKSIFKMLPAFWKESTSTTSGKYFSKNTAQLCIIKDLKITGHQIWMVLEKICRLAHHALHAGGLNLISRRWKHPKSLRNLNFAFLCPKDINSISLKRYKICNHILSAQESSSIVNIIFSIYPCKVVSYSSRFNLKYMIYLS